MCAVHPCAAPRTPLPRPNDAALQTAYPHYCRQTDLRNQPAPGGALPHLTTAGRRIEGFLRRGIRAGFMELVGPLWRTLWKTLTMIFFSGVLRNENHVLHPLLSERNDHGYELRRRRHERILTSTDDKRNFIYRELHKYIY